MSRQKSTIFGCPVCGEPTFVYDSWTEGDRIRRRRKCKNNHRFNSSEKFTTPVEPRGPVPVDLRIPDAYDELEAELRAERGW